MFDWCRLTLGQLFVYLVTRVHDEVHRLGPPNNYSLHNVRFFQFLGPLSKFVLGHLHGAGARHLLLSVRIDAVEHVARPIRRSVGLDALIVFDCNGAASSTHI
jgi:hypothetical protein